MSVSYLVALLLHLCFDQTFLSQTETLWLFRNKFKYLVQIVQILVHMHIDKKTKHFVYVH